MPLIIEPDFDDVTSKEHHDFAVHPVRRVFCTGCLTGNTYKPEQWVFTKAQVQSWVEEHKDHKAAGGKK